MNGYEPIIGSVIRLDCITSSQEELISELLRLYNKHKDSNSSPGEFVEEARGEISRYYPEQRSFMGVCSGPVGKIFNDCFYRLVLHQAKEIDRPRILRNIRYHPARLLLDRFLLEWGTQYEFSQKLGIESKRLSDWLCTILGKTDNPTDFSLEEYMKACDKIGITATFNIQGPEYEFDLSQKPFALCPPPEYPIVQIWSPEYTRDHLFRTLVAAVAPLIDAGQIEEPLRILGLHLAALHGITDLLLINRYAKMFFEEIRSHCLKKVRIGPDDFDIVESWPEKMFPESVALRHEDWLESYLFRKTVEALKVK